MCYFLDIDSLQIHVLFFYFILQVNGSSPADVVLVSNAIMRSEFLSGTQQRIMVEKLMERLQ
jgi:hypothetical protein